jgi:hypothetical protein
LLSDPHTAGWHELGMEWKEHVAWMAPILMTMAAWVLMRYKEAVEQQRRLRVTVAMFALTGLLATGVAAGFGAWINKKAPVAGGSTIALAQDRKQRQRFRTEGRERRYWLRAWDVLRLGFWLLPQMVRKRRRGC